MSAQRKRKLFPGDRYILCRFDIRWGCIVEASSDNLDDVLKEIPEHLNDGEDSTLSICQVNSWIGYDGNELDPLEPRTLYEIHHYADPDESEDEPTD